MPSPAPKLSQCVCLFDHAAKDRSFQLRSRDAQHNTQETQRAIVALNRPVAAEPEPKTCCYSHGEILDSPRSVPETAEEWNLREIVDLNGILSRLISEGKDVIDEISYHNDDAFSKKKSRSRGNVSETRARIRRRVRSLM